MDKKSSLSLAVGAGLVVVLLVVGVLLASRRANAPSNGAVGQTNTNHNKNTNTDLLPIVTPDNETLTPDLANRILPLPANVRSTVHITASGFSPESVTVAQGGTVTWINDDSIGHWPASDPHPIHTNLPGFDALKSLKQGESYTFTFTKQDTWTYHDHLLPSRTGTVIVQ